MAGRWVDNSSVRGVLAAHGASFAAAAVGVAGLAWAFGVFDGVRGVESWLSRELFKLWGYEVFLSVACAAAGYAVLDALVPSPPMTALERLALALPLGLVCFVVGMYAGGFLGLYGAVFAIAMPGILLLIGARSLLRTRALWREEAGTPPSVVALAAFAFGVVALATAYFGLLSPDAVNYDASWNHLVIAQDYAREGRIVPFPGDWVKNVPHLGSIVNTWAFLVPGLQYPALRWMMALHNEFTVLCWTLVGVAAGVNACLYRFKLRGAWAAVFLFPGLFVYDGNLGAAADHFAAVFVVPVFLVALRALERLEFRWTTLLGMLSAGALLTKFHAVYLLTPLALVLGGRAAMLIWRGRAGAGAAPSAREALTGIAAGAAAFLLVASLHFGKNFVYYDNPFYPLGQRFFAGTPTIPDAATHIDYLFADWRFHPPTVLSDRIREALAITFTFSFEPHYTFIGNIPTFGSLYTLTLPMIPFLGRERRLWLAAGVSLAAVFAWAMTFRVDRNLQILLPLMATVTGAVLARAWQLGWVVRPVLLALVLLQVAWGADYWFSGIDRINGSLSLIRSGIDGRAAWRFDSYRAEYVRLGRSLPKDAKIVLHQQHVMLGIDRPILLDLIGFQGLFDYDTFRSASDYEQRLRELGVTHAVWASPRNAASKQEAVIFEAFVARHAKTTKQFGALRATPLNQWSASHPRVLHVLSYGLNGYANGLYDVRQLSVCENMPPERQKFPQPKRKAVDAASTVALLEEADVVLLRAGVTLPTEAAAELAAFGLRYRYSDFTVFERERAGARAGGPPVTAQDQAPASENL